MPTTRVPFLLVALTLATCAAAPAQVSGPTIGGERGHPTDESVQSGWLEHRWARSDLERLAAAVRAHEERHGALPLGAGFESLEPGLLSDATPVDPWGQPYLLVSGPRRGVLSSGPDRTPGTDDDLTIPLGGGALQPEAAGVPPLPGAAAARAPTPASPEARTTHRRMEALSRALESFKKERGHYPVGLDATGLEEALVPEHVAASAFSGVDAWGRPWRYRSNDVGSSYTLVSSGSDGVHERLVPLRPGPVGGDERDLVVVDGRFVRWPLGSWAEPAGRPAPRATAPAAEPVAAALHPARRSVEPGKAATTTERLEAIAEALVAFRAREGRYPEMDDAARLMSLLGIGHAATDGWGRDLGYLSLASGSRCVIASRGGDGRFGRSLEEYLRGASAAGDDLVWVNGKPLR